MPRRENRSLPIPGRVRNEVHDVEILCVKHGKGLGGEVVSIKLRAGLDHFGDALGLELGESLGRNASLPRHARR